MKGRGFRLKSLNWAALVLAVLLAMHVSLAYTYLQGRQERSSLEQDLALQEKVVSKTDPPANPVRRADLERELQAAQAEREAARSFFPPEELAGNRLLNSVLSWAQVSGVEVLNAGAPPLGKEVVQGHTYQVRVFSIDIAGEYEQILAFLDSLEAGPLQGLIVKRVDISRSEATFNGSVHFMVYGGVVQEATPPKASATPKEKEKEG